MDAGRIGDHVHQSVSTFPPIHDFYSCQYSSVLGSLFSEFFRKGQVLETFRGQGVFQPAVDAAIRQLNDGAWVSLL